MAGEAKATLKRSLTVGAVTIGGISSTFTADGNLTFQKTIPANTTDARITLAVDVSNVKAAGLESSKNCTVKTNSTGSPVDTIALIAGKPEIWALGDVADFFLTADVTDFYITTGSEDTLVKFGCSIDYTPVLS